MKVEFRLDTRNLGFHDQKMKYAVEPGRFTVQTGGSSNSGLEDSFELLE